MMRRNNLARNLERMAKRTKVAPVKEWMTQEEADRREHLNTDPNGSFIVYEPQGSAMRKVKIFNLACWGVWAALVVVASIVLLVDKWVV